MAEFYCDHGAYASALGTTPTWGVPQEGDGGEIGPAASASVASIAFSAVPTSGNFSVCGVTFTSPAGVVNAASVDAAANALAGLINASTTAVGSSVAVGTPQLRNLVFARGPSGGAPAGTCQIMMRVGSTTLNHASNSNVALAHTFTGTPTVTQFAGGVSGCWGWLLNTSALGVASSIGARSYGLLIASRPYVCLGALPTIADTIWVRTGSGVNLDLGLNNALNMSSVAYPQHIVFDTNTKWTSDSGNGVVTIENRAESGIDLQVNLTSTGFAKQIRCIRRGALRLTANLAGAHQCNYVLWGNSLLLDGVAFEETETSSVSARVCWFVSFSSSTSARLKRCDLLLPRPRSSWGGALTGALNGSVHLEGCRVVVNHTSGADPGPVVTVSNANDSWHSSVKMTGCAVSGWSFGKHRFAQANSFSYGATEFVCEYCTGISLGPSYMNFSQPSTGNPSGRTFTFLSGEAGSAFRFENHSGVADWNPDAAPAYPTLRATQMDGATKWSVKLDWFAATVTGHSNLSTPRLGQINRLPDGVRTIALDFLTPVGVSPVDVAMRVHYIGTDGVSRCETTLGLPGALSTPSVSWDGIASYPSHSPRRLSLTTSSAVRNGTEIVVFFEVTRPPPGGSGIQIYVDPEPLIS